MAKITSSLLTLASLLALGLSTAPSHALNTRSFISANGLDTNACTRTAPCRTLQKAHDSTSANGEINMLDPAGYGTVTITKSISIVNDGVGSAGVLVPSGGTGITINAGSTDAINLRGLIIEGAGVGERGITLLSAKSLTIENCVVRNLMNHGIALVPNSDLQATHIAVSNTFVANNGGNGIYLQPSGAPNGGRLHAVFSRVEAYKNSDSGIASAADLVIGNFNIMVTVTDSVSAHNSLRGFYAVKGTGTEPGQNHRFILVRSIAASNNIGINAINGADMVVAESTVSNNAYGWLGVGVRSFGDNNFIGNLNNEGPFPQIISKR